MREIILYPIVGLVMFALGFIYGILHLPQTKSPCLGEFTVTAYRSIPEQTDSSPWRTSIHQRVNENGIAVSQDLLAAGIVHYGDVVYLEGIGYKIVNDCMNIRHKQRFDIWVPTHKLEKEFHDAYKGKKIKIWLIQKN